MADGTQRSGETRARAHVVCLEPGVSVPKLSHSGVMSTEAIMLRSTPGPAGRFPGYGLAPPTPAKVAQEERPAARVRRAHSTAPHRIPRGHALRAPEPSPGGGCRAPFSGRGRRLVLRAPCLRVTSPSG